VTPSIEKTPEPKRGVTEQVAEPQEITSSGDGVTPLFGKSPDTASKVPFLVPPSTFSGAFYNPTHPERLLFLDTETSYPWPHQGDYPQPELSSPGLLQRKEKRREAHPWAKDPRRCALRFLTIQCGDYLPVTHDMMDGPIPESLRDLIASSTLIVHNLDFDISILRRYGISVSSSIIDTMIAARLLGLGKEKIQSGGFDDEIDEPYIRYGPAENPADNALDAVALRYLGIRIDKKLAKLGNSDWGASDISDSQHQYMRWDVEHLPALWSVLKKELENAGLYSCFIERMQFFPHLNQIKMTGVPIDAVIRDSDREAVSAFKTQKREELREMFKDYRHPVPKSRQKKIKVQTQDGKFKRVPVEETEEFSPSNRAHVIAALAHHGIEVQDIQKTTLTKIDAPECRLLREYAQAKTRLAAIDGVARSTFPDGRVRAAGWNQLAAVTGRLTSVEPNLQNIPRDWRHAFIAPDPYQWLSIDLAQIEVYIIALHTNCERLISLLASGKDVYVETIAPILGCVPVRGNEPCQVTDQLRGVGKVLVLGTDYGLTIYGFVRQVETLTGIRYEFQEAQRFFDAFFELYPEIKLYHDQAAAAAYDATEVRTVTGLRRFLPELKDDQDPISGYWPSLESRKRILCNTPIQGSGADLVVRAVNRFMPQLPEGVEIINLVHDEVNALCLPDQTRETISVITEGFSKTFREFFGDRLTIKLEASVGRSWADK
jgi:DNA polymerase-1